MWILILTLATGGDFRSGIAMTTSVSSVGGFQSQSACLEAGNSWIAQQRDMRLPYSIGMKAKALCAHSGAKQ